MSEEEKIAKLELNRFIYGKQLSKDDIADYLGILFNLIEKQQKEIDDLKEITQNYNAIGGETFGDDGYFKKNYITKNKIREKIIKNCYLTKENDKVVKFEALKELLEEE